MSDSVFSTCKNGHLLTPENTQRSKGSKYIQCRQCRKEARRGKQSRPSRAKAFAGLPVQDRPRAGTQEARHTAAKPARKPRKVVILREHPSADECPHGCRLIALGGRSGVGRFAVVDASDYEGLARINWCVNRMGYPASRMGLMHRQLMDVPHGLMVDHINGDTLDNRRGNLRIVTHQQNMQNRRPNHNARSRYKGVTWNGSKWEARLMLNGVRNYLGAFSSELDAAQAYDEAIRIHHGEYARPNFT